MRISSIDKPLVALRIAACTIALLLAAGPASQAVLASGNVAGAGPLRVGWAMADLTPEVPVHIAGGSSLRVSEGVKDPIVATVLVIESVDKQGTDDMLIMVGCDLARAEKALCDRVRELVAELQPEIDVSKIVLNATHNHGAPCVRTAPELAAELAKHALEGSCRVVVLRRGARCHVAGGVPGIRRSPDRQGHCPGVEGPQARRCELRSGACRCVAQSPGGVRQWPSQPSSATRTGPTSATSKATRTIRSGSSTPTTPAAN